MNRHTCIIGSTVNLYKAITNKVNKSFVVIRDYILYYKCKTQSTSTVTLDNATTNKVNKSFVVTRFIFFIINVKQVNSLDHSVTISFRPGKKFYKK